MPTEKSAHNIKKIPAERPGITRKFHTLPPKYINYRQIMRFVVNRNAYL